METGYEAHTKTTRCGGSSGVKGVAVPLNDSLSESKWKFTDSFPSSSLALPGLAWFSFSFRLAFRFFTRDPMRREFQMRLEDGGNATNANTFRRTRGYS